MESVGFIAVIASLPLLGLGVLIIYDWMCRLDVRDEGETQSKRLTRRDRFRGSRYDDRRSRESQSSDPDSFRLIEKSVVSRD